jgi:hypothetical protein
VATPTMRAHLWDHAKKITDLFHPPPSKPAKASTETLPTEKKRLQRSPN